MATKKAEEVEAGWELVADEEGEPWKPTKAGEILVGRYTGFALAVDPESLNGSPREFKIYHLQTESGLRSVYSTYKLDSVFEKLNPGDDVSITFIGKISIGNGAQTMNDFKVLVRRNTNTVN